MSYAAIIEIVGIKELVEDNFNRFSEVTNSFKEKILQNLSSSLRTYKDTNINIYIFRDHCYIQASTLISIISFIKRLRTDFFKGSNYFFRAVVTSGILKIEPTSPKEVPKEDNSGGKGQFTIMEFGEVSTRLFAMMERFKGIGIMLDIDFLEKSKELENLKKNVFINFYITDILNRKYQPFYDIGIDSKDLLYDDLKKIFVRLNGDRIYSKKLVRFYIPLLINLARHFDPYNNNIEDEFSLNNIITRGFVTKNKDVTGFEYFYFMLVEKFFSIDYNERLRKEGKEEFIIKFEKDISSLNWLVELLRNDSRFSDIPKEILSNSKRRIALRKISEIIQEREIK